MEATAQSSKKKDVSGLTGLANLVQNKYSGYTRKEVFELIKKVRDRNSGKLVGLKMKKFWEFVKKIVKEDAAIDKIQANLEKKKQRALEATCPFCYKLFIEKFSRDRHVKKIHHKQEHREVKTATETASECTICKKSFYHLSNLKRHMRLHEENPPEFQCDICGKKFTREDNLFKHRERLHELFKINFDAIDACSQQTALHCKMCGARFQADIDAFRNHIADEVCKKKEDFIEVNDRGRIECDLCDKTYVDVKSLRRHLLSIHGSGKKKLICEKCSKTFSYRSSLVKHIKEKHYD